jgi:hypothetical protein
MQVDLSTVCVLNFWCRLVKLMNDLRVCLIGIENKIITMIYNVFLKYVINVIQYPVLLAFLLSYRLAPYQKMLVLLIL